MDTMEITKIVGATCGALLVFLLIGSAADTVIHGPASFRHHDSQNAYVIEVPEDEPAGEEAAEETEMAAVDFDTLLAEADVSSGERIFRACAACHKLEEGANAVGPHLYGVVGREVAAVEGYSYSGALAEQADVWTPDNLSGFLEAPANWAPGTKMSYRGLNEAEDRADLIAYLDSIDD